MVSEAPVSTHPTDRPGDTSAFGALLEEIVPRDEQPDPREDPGAAFRTLFDGWVALGKYERGKPRRSVRQVKEWLGRDGEVRSLETKLAGKTRLQQSDAGKLLRLFLTHWDYDGTRDQPHRGDRDALVGRLTLDLYPPGSAVAQEGLALPRRSRRNGEQSSAEPQGPSPPVDESRPSAEVIEELFNDSDALFTVSREQTIIGANPAEAMQGFQSLMDDLWQVDRADDRFRALVWIIDIGRLQPDGGAQLALHNLEFLATQFRALSLIEHPERSARWSWFSDHVAILVGGLQRQKIDLLYDNVGFELPETAVEWPWITADRLFFETLPDRWHDRPALDALLGAHSSARLKRTITVHARKEGWKKTSDLDEDPQDDLRFWWHTPPAEAGAIADDGGARCVELPRPGRRWGSVFRLAHAAVLGRLDRAEQLGEFDSLQAIVHLRRYAFAALRLHEFLNLTNLIATNE